MAQYIINIGATANDGTGDPLRTAFNEVNLNFDQIWNVGPVGSNIAFVNNSIITTNTNGNLILAPNGIGSVNLAASIIPDYSSIRNIGTANLKMGAIYAQYLQVDNFSPGNISFVDLTVTGNMSVAGNSTLNGNVFLNHNITVDGSGYFGNVLQVNGNITSVGGVFHGNGSGLTHINAANIDGAYGNSNVAIYLQTSYEAPLAAGQQAIAIGQGAGYSLQQSNSIAIGSGAGTYRQGYLTQGNAIAIGTLAGGTSQAGNSIAIGVQAGANNQSINGIAIGYLAQGNAGGAGVAIGTRAGFNNQQNSIAIGEGSGQNNQDTYAIGIGINAGGNTQGQNSVAVGQSAGRTTQGINSVAIGSLAGYDTQGIYSVAVGAGAGQSNQGANTVAIGQNAGFFNQGFGAVAIGANAALISQGANSIAIVATGIPRNNLPANSLTIDPIRANNAPNQNLVLTYNNTSKEVTQSNTQSSTFNWNVGGNLTVGSGQITLGSNAVAGLDSVMIGNQAGTGGTAGNYSIAIGARAGTGGTANNSIILNATGTTLQGGNSGFYVAPVRNDPSNTFNAVWYNSATDELTYAPLPAPLAGTNVLFGGNVQVTANTSPGQSIITFTLPEPGTYMVSPAITGSLTYSGNVTAGVVDPNGILVPNTEISLVGTTPYLTNPSYKEFYQRWKGSDQGGVTSGTAIVFDGAEIDQSPTSQAVLPTTQNGIASVFIQGGRTYELTFQLQCGQFTQGNTTLQFAWVDALSGDQLTPAVTVSQASAVNGFANMTVLHTPGATGVYNWAYVKCISNTNGSATVVGAGSWYTVKVLDGVESAQTTATGTGTFAITSNVANAIYTINVWNSYASIGGFIGNSYVTSDGNGRSSVTWAQLINAGGAGGGGGGSYGNAQVAAFLPVYGGNILASSVEVTGTLDVGNLSVDNLTASANVIANTVTTNSLTLLNTLSISGNIIPTANKVYTLGNSTNQWASIYIGANTLYIENNPITVVANTLTFKGNSVVTTTSSTGNTAISGNLNVAGNIVGAQNIAIANIDAYIVTANYFVGDISNATGGYGDANVEVLLASGNVGNLVANTITSNSVMVDGTVTANYFAGDGSNLTNIQTGNITFDNTTIYGNSYAVAQNYTVSIQPSLDFTNTLAILPTADSDIHLYESVLGGGISLGNYGDSNIKVAGPNTGNAITIQTIDSTNGPAFTIQDILTTTPAIISINELMNLPDGSKIYVNGVTTTTQVNGSWYVQFESPTGMYLYHDANLSQPVNGTTWSPYYEPEVATGVNTYVTDGHVGLFHKNNVNMTDVTSSWTVSGGNLSNVAIQAVDTTSDPLNIIVTLTPQNFVSGGTYSFYSPNTYPGNGTITTGTTAGSITLSAGVTGNLDYGIAGDIFINTGSGGNYYTWKFNSAGVLTNPFGGYLGATGLTPWTSLSGGNGNPVSIDSYYTDGSPATEIIAYPTGEVAISTYTDGGNVANTWTFDDSSTLTFPETSTIFEKPVSNWRHGLNIVGPTDNSSVLIYGYGSDGKGFGAGALYVNNNNVQIITNNQRPGGVGDTWTFDNFGNLTLPGNTFSVNYANGTPVQLGGGGNVDTGNIGFVTDFIYDEYGITVENASLSLPATAAISIPANGNAITPILLNNLAGNVVIQASANGVGGSQTFAFDVDGNLSVPSNIISAGITTFGSQGNITGAFAISAQYLYGDGSNITGIAGNGANLTNGNNVVALTSTGQLNLTNVQIGIQTTQSAFYGEQMALYGTRRIISPDSSTYPTAQTVAVTETPTTIYTASTANIWSFKMTVRVQHGSGGSPTQSQMADIIATMTDTYAIAFSVTNRIKTDATEPDVTFTVATNPSNFMIVSAVTHAGGIANGQVYYFNYDVVEFSKTND